MFDRSFFKLRNIEVYYNFPKAMLAKTKLLNAAKLYVRGVDLFSFDHLDESDIRRNQSSESQHRGWFVSNILIILK